MIKPTYCPCLYIVQLYDKTPALLDGSLQCGDEIVAINGVKVKGLSKTELAKMIQASQDHVQLQFNKLICDTKKVRNLNFTLKILILTPLGQNTRH